MSSANPAPSISPDAANRCWGTIGIWGDGSCPELAVHVHCGNCPVFSGAARGLLDRTAPANYLQEWAETLRNPGEKREETISVLIFRLGPAWLALPAANVVSVTEQRPVHRLPHRTSRIFSGLVNVAGELQLAFDLRALFELPSEVSEGMALSRRVYPRLLLCRFELQSFAFTADEVYGTMALAVARKEPTADAPSATLATYATGQFSFNDRTVRLLDGELLAHGIARLPLA